MTARPTTELKVEKSAARSPAAADAAADSGPIEPIIGTSRAARRRARIRNLPPNASYWTVLYESRWSRTRGDAPQRTMTALYALLDQRSVRPFTLRDLASRAGVGVATASRVVDRLEALGLLTTGGGNWVAAGRGRGYTEPLVYRTHWPPRPTGGADRAATGWADPG